MVNNNHSLNQEQGGVERTYGGRTAGSDELWLFEDADFAGNRRVDGLPWESRSITAKRHLETRSTGPSPRRSRP